jgi:hypothetical protein
MVVHFVPTDTDTDDIPERLRSRSWIASALRFVRQRTHSPKQLRFKDWLASTMRFTRPMAERLSKLIKQPLQPGFTLLIPPHNRCEQLNNLPLPLEHTTALKPINLDWYMFFTISPPLIFGMPPGQRFRSRFQRQPSAL